MTEKYANLRARLAALKLAGPVSTDARAWNAATDALDVELVAELLAERDAMVQAQPAAESPCACWPGRMCTRSAQCARDAQPAAVSGAKTSSIRLACEMLDSYIECIKASGEYDRWHYIPQVEIALDDLRAILALRPQAVPMTDVWFDGAMRLADAYADACFDQGLNQRTEDPNPEAKREKLADHLRGITAQAKEVQK